jgi:hypothetical protein
MKAMELAVAQEDTCCKIAIALKMPETGILSAMREETGRRQ